MPDAGPLRHRCALTGAKVLFFIKLPFVINDSFDLSMLLSSPMCRIT